MSYIDVTGKTEEEAVRKGLQQLGLERDDVSVEILERAKSGFLGLGGNPARVRLTYGQDEPEAVEAVEPVKPAAPAPVVDKREKTETEKKPQPRRTEKKPAPVAEPAPAVEAAAPVAPAAAPVAAEAKTVCTDDNAGRIVAFLDGLLQHMECPAEVKVYESEKGRYKVILEGQKLGALIGRRGETLDAIQQLTNYAVNSGSEKRIRVHVDAENYRAKRERSLESLAEKVAGKVIKYRRSVTLEPMNAYERHVIHATLQEHTGVTTYSIGSEPNRRVVVAFDRDKR